MAGVLKTSLTAMGDQPIPDEICVGGEFYGLDRVYKNDFFAVTARYVGCDQSIILKIHRQAPFLCFPMEWVGRMLAGRECVAFSRLSDVGGIPRLIARWGRTGVVREYIAGHALSKGERVCDEFHPALRSLIGEIHARGMAYVDLEKCENVLVGDDGQPHLFDFQIAWYWPSRWGGELWPLRRLRGWFQRGDLYHLVKLQRRTRPDQLSEAELTWSYKKPWYLRVHVIVSRPFTRVRRAVLNRIDPRSCDGERGRVSS